MKYKISCLIVFALVSNCLKSFSQGTEDQSIYKVGSPAPEFVLKEMINYPKKTARLGDFKGKWLILDFWTTGCTVCVASFPKVDALQKSLGNKATIIVIGKKDHHIRPMFERFQKHYSLDFIAAFDTLLFNQFKIRTVPQIVWIDEKGIIRQITYSSDMTLKNIESIIKGEIIVIPQKKELGRFQYGGLYDMSRPLLFNNNFGSDSNFLFRSLLIDWKPDMPFNIVDFTKEYHWSLWMPKGMQELGVGIEMLYRVAFTGYQHFSNWDTSSYGRFYPWAAVEIQDSTSLAEYNHVKDKRYCYSLMAPEGKTRNDEMMLVMQNDLRSYFGWDVQLETRMMPCWKLILKNPKHNLLTKGGEVQFPNDIGAAGFRMANIPMAHLIGMMINYHSRQPPIIDETGISGNIDIDFNAVMTDWNDIKRELQRHGMELIKSEKLMKVIVVRDKYKIISGIPDEK